MTDDVSNLPEWPEKASFDMGLYAEERHYYAELAEAALARMEALVEELRDLRHAFSDDMFCSELERIDALLAACERSQPT